MSKVKILDEKIELLEDGRVMHSYMTDNVDFAPNVLEGKKIGVSYSRGYTIMDSKEAAIEFIEKDYNQTKENLEGVNRQLDLIKVNDSLANELSDFVNNTIKVMEAIKEVKDFSSSDYVANNPKKFGKMLREARLLKENVIGELKEIDKVTGMYNRKQELLDQQKLYAEQLEKIEKQLEQTRAL